MLLKKLVLGGLLGLLVLSAATPASAARDKGPKLREQYEKWLDDVAVLLSKAERRAFMALEHDYQRDGFIRRFWEARDPYPETERNEFQIDYQRRLEHARAEYFNLLEDRSRVLLAQGFPDGLTETNCGMRLARLEIWSYRNRGRRLGSVTLIFHQPGGTGPFRLWRWEEGFEALEGRIDTGSAAEGTDYFAFRETVRRACGADAANVLAAIDSVRVADMFHTLDLVQQAPPPRDSEWLETFRGFSTDLPPGVDALPAEVEIGFPSRDGARTVVQTVLLIPTAAATPLVLGDRRSYNFMVTGEILRDDALFESFRYRFDLPIDEQTAATLPLAFERLLRPGAYQLILRVEDQQSKRAFRAERAMVVPLVEGAPAAADTAEVTAALAGARADLAGGATNESAGTSVRLLALGEELQTGPVRLAATVTGDPVARVSFFLDGKAALTKAKPPYEVELNLGALPRPHQVRAVAYAADGSEVAADTLDINEAAQRFTIRLLEPDAHTPQRDRLTARAEVSVPDGAELERVEFYRNEERVATLYQPPWSQSIPLPRGAGAGYVRAVAILIDGHTTEDLALFNAPEAQGHMDVRLVEVYAGVVDGAGRPVAGLEAGDFSIAEDGVPQQIVRFEPVRDLPIHLVLALDTSASMAKSLPEVQRAALLLLERMIQPKDRAALVTFSDHPSLAVSFTSDLPQLATALAGLTAERGTALHDALVYGLTYLRGVRGAQALMLLSDGSDRASQTTFDEALEYARRSGVAVYTVGAQIGRANLTARNHLCKFATETGGSCHFIESANELAAVYAEIEAELRSRYLLVYQPLRASEPGAFRQVEVHVDGSGREVKAMRGYYP